MIELIPTIAAHVFAFSDGANAFFSIASMMHMMEGI
jgi:hypothetical protein